ncbi:unnamed protein product [Lampetra planeri]
MCHVGPWQEVLASHAALATSRNERVADGSGRSGWTRCGHTETKSQPRTPTQWRTGDTRRVAVTPGAVITTTTVSEDQEAA